MHNQNLIDCFKIWAERNTSLSIVDAFLIRQCIYLNVAENDNALFIIIDIAKRYIPYSFTCIVKTFLYG